jgi:hypothetical protein
MLPPVSAPDTDRPSSRFRTLVALAMALVSVLSAVVAWRAAVVSIRASDLAEDGMLQLVQREQIEGRLRAQVQEDLRLFVEYQEHVKAWRLLLDDAEEIRAQHPDLASDLQAEAQSELSQARALRPFFRTIFVDLGNRKGDVEFGGQAGLEYLFERNADLQDLQPDVLFDGSEREYGRVVNLILTVALLLTALLFLTLAQFRSPSTRGIFAWAGGAVAVAGTVLFVVLGFVS